MQGKNKKHRELTMGPQFPAGLLSYLCSSDSSVKHAFTLDERSRILTVLSERNREESARPSPPECKSLFVVLLVKTRVACLGCGWQ